MHLFDARFASQTRKYHSTKKLRKHVCQLILACTTQAFKPGQLHLDHCRVSNRSPWLVYNHSMVLKKRLLSLSSSRVIGLCLGSESCSPSRATSQSSRNFVLLVALAPCYHGPFIVRCAPSLSTVSWFHSVSASVSMFTINTDNCLFLFLFLCWCLRVCIGFLCTYRGLCAHRGCSLSPDPS